jgi:hypothetical protein
MYIIIYILYYNCRGFTRGFVKNFRFFVFGAICKNIAKKTLETLDKT